MIFFLFITSSGITGNLKKASSTKAATSAVTGPKAPSVTANSSSKTDNNIDIKEVKAKQRAADNKVCFCVCVLTHVNIMTLYYVMCLVLNLCGYIHNAPTPFLALLFLTIEYVCFLLHRLLK